MHPKHLIKKQLKLKISFCHRWDMSQTSSRSVLLTARTWKMPKTWTLNANPAFRSQIRTETAIIQSAGLYEPEPLSRLYTGSDGASTNTEYYILYFSTDCVSISARSYTASVQIDWHQMTPSSLYQSTKTNFSKGNWTNLKPPLDIYGLLLRRGTESQWEEQKFAEFEIQGEKKHERGSDAEKGLSHIVI